MIDQKTIEHIAKLARLSITSEEAIEYGEQLTKVLNHFQQISKIETTGIEPLVTPAEIEFYARADEARHETTTDEMLMNAPDKAGNLFKVPPVV
ncbi:MAG: Asp-tRNA(Asn)/Glu-tRNA(Gln) amidotransferase subunit GatC [Bdellovibrionota bacterium]